MLEHPDPSTLFSEAIAAIAKDRFVDRLWQRDGTLFATSHADQATARAARDGLGWVFDTQALRDAVDQLAILARVVERLRYDRVVVVAPPPIAAWCDAVGRHLKGKRGLPLVALWGTTDADVAAALDDGKAAKPLWIFIATTDSPAAAVSAYSALSARLRSTDDCVAIAPAGSELDRLARRLAFRETFALPADIGARFAAVSMASLVPAALAGVVLHDALARAEDLLDQCRDLAPDLNPGVRLGAWLWANGHRRQGLHLSFSKDCRGFADWVAHMAAVPGGACLWPIQVARPAAEAAWWVPRAPAAILVSVSTFAHPDDPVAEAARAAGVPDEAFVLPDVADWWAEAVRWQFALATWGHLARRNPFAAAGAAASGSQPAPELPISALAALPRALTDSLVGLDVHDRVVVTVQLPAAPATLQRLEALRESLARATVAGVVVSHPGRWPQTTVDALPDGCRGLVVHVDAEFGDGVRPGVPATAHGWQAVHAFLASTADPS